MVVSAGLGLSPVARCLDDVVLRKDRSDHDLDHVRLDDWLELGVHEEVVPDFVAPEDGVPDVRVQAALPFNRPLGDEPAGEAADARRSCGERKSWNLCWFRLVRRKSVSNQNK